MQVTTSDVDHKSLLSEFEFLEQQKKRAPHLELLYSL